ncbi:MAG TPA: bifunctional phosphoribosyl-AMP cyclohydrolase/phosphoribosyl-ATP diphosphatase HisIE [Cyclobacteriaceae bacterium]|nr:bifunctional phosphoribosyl-AMP cyclohydrolase/phosphoribosyl-ATP diphosphatase HisIE [Cyclobacteriaceae bacterium]
MNFSKLNGLVPCVIQDLNTSKVLMLGFMNEEAYMKTMHEKRVTFYSRSKQRLWTKGETSGNWMEVVEIKEDCDQDSLLIKVIPKGPVCHTGADTCFNERNNRWNLKSLEAIIADRKKNPTKDSYTSKLFESGINKIAQKVGEEAVELVIEAKDNNMDRFNNEAADLLFHYLVLLAAKNSTLDDVLKVLEGRHKN